ncbi:MAG: hypothetical protein R2706_13085 [Acidimicrobiales bacterium]
MFIVEDTAPNAASVMVNDRMAVVVTRGLIDTLSRIELVAASRRLNCWCGWSGDAEAATAGSALLATRSAHDARSLQAWPDRSPPRRY